VIRKLSILIIQPDIVWLDVQKNLAKYESYLVDLKTNIDLVLLPEMFATGFVIDPKDFVHMNQQVVMNWMRKMANIHNTCIAGSHLFFYKEKYYNRFHIAFPDGSCSNYDKRHLFKVGGEDRYFTAGNNRLVFEVKGWKIMPLICYDLRFPVWSRNNVMYDILLYSANWPSARINVWEILLKARAIENQCYVIGINRIGTDGRAIEYCGQSQVINPLGEVIGRLPDREDLLTVSLDINELSRLRKEFPVLGDSDSFIIK
jgi:predicted amidohydrolase